MLDGERKYSPHVAITPAQSGSSMPQGVEKRWVLNNIYGTLSDSQIQRSSLHCIR